MNFIDSITEAISMIASMFSRGFAVFIFGVLLPLLIGLGICAMAILYTIDIGNYALTGLSVLAGVGWFFFWLNFTDDWIT